MANDETLWNGLARSLDYLESARRILDKIGTTQSYPIGKAVALCAERIARGGLIHLFGSGHSRMAVEEMFPRYGSFPGFHPIVELSLTNHHAVVGSNGQRQAMFLENVEGLGQTIVSNFRFGPDDAMMLFSHSGTSCVVIDIALEMRRLGLPVVAVTSLEHSRLSEPKHGSGHKLFELADIVIDNGAPAGDAMVRIEGLDVPVGPGSTIGNTAIVNMIKCGVAQRLVELGRPPSVLASELVAGRERSKRLFEAAYDEFRESTRRL